MTDRLTLAQEEAFDEVVGMIRIWEKGGVYRGVPQPLGRTRETMWALVRCGLLERHVFNGADRYTITEKGAKVA